MLTDSSTAGLNMDPRSEVILRQINYFKGTLLLAGLPADHLMAELKASVSSVSGWSWQMEEFSQLQQQYSEQVIFDTSPPVQLVDQIVIFLPKSKELTEYLLQRCASRLTKNGQLFLVGEKRAGIERAAKQLSQYGKTIKLDSARHCQLWQCSVSDTIKDKPLAQWAKQYPVCIEGHQNLNIISLPGVFSHGELDKGTALLLQQLDGLSQGNILDFGCGSGVIGTFLKKKYPKATLNFLDVDAFALAATQLTLQANDIALDDSIHIIAGRGIVDAPQQLTAIISNPPFHQGIHTSYQASEDLFKQALAHLNPHGEIRIVANSFLKYSPLIEKYFGHCNTLTHRNGFHIYQAKRTKH
jgi:16S rRNA (guanine1207-N2)-methyltransferase